MKTNKIVTGSARYVGNNQILIEWEHPDTGEIMTCQGEFYYDFCAETYEHDMIDYLVLATEERRVNK